jgi:hypothetical protein
MEASAIQVGTIHQYRRANLLTSAKEMLPFCSMIDSLPFHPGLPTHLPAAGLTIPSKGKLARTIPVFQDYSELWYSH